MTETVFPAAVDLRSGINQVYDQSQTGACTAHAVVNALDAMYDNAGQSKRFSRAWIWYWGRKFSGHGRDDYGVEFEGMKWALETKGAVLESTCPWTGSQIIWQDPAPSPSVVGQISFELLPSSDIVNLVKRKLSFGLPVILTMYVYQSLYALQDKKDWRTHTWSTGGAHPSLHTVCIMGYDDAAGRFLVENSWGPQWGDGGFFGIPYADFGRIRQQLWSIDRIFNFHPVKVEGFVTVPYLLDPMDNSIFTVKNKARLQLAFSQALETGGFPAVLDLCRSEHVTDKHLCNLFLWPRDAVRVFQEANPQLDWTNFPWATT